MARRAMKVCSCTGNGCDAHPGSCPQIVDTGRCTRCGQAAERRRGTAAARGYAGDHQTFRAKVLERDPTCKHPGCTQPSRHADHYPLSRRELVARHIDPNDPKHGRGMCHRHHSRETAREQPGGWNAR